MKTRYAFDADTGLLTDKDGNTLGVVTAIVIDDKPSRVRGGARSSGPTSTATTTAEETEVKKLERPTASQLEAAAVARVWEHYLAVIPSKRKLDPKRNRIIAMALRSVGEDAVKLAVTGLSRSPHHNGENEQRRTYLEIRYALKGIGDESDDERIEKAISWAALHAPGTTTVSAAKVERWLEEVRYTASQPHNPERDRGLAAWRALKAAGFNVVRLDKQPWARIER